MLLIHQRGYLLGACINRPGTGKSSPQGTVVKLAVFRICPKHSEARAVSGDDTHLTCSVEPECHLYIPEAGHLTLAQVLTLG